MECDYIENQKFRIVQISDKPMFRTHPELFCLKFSIPYIASGGPRCVVDIYWAERGQKSELADMKHSFISS